ncbi:hypothetical protein Mlute_02604 [Meiothermus luteus]|jgi:hypothetical protein|uniref:Lipoprotein n=1 Tax=Meiothermus luteus TaxID=2026184 RepID=A0A399EGA6_9DEIN|nr:hypothetical protein [Meiothermus luteus]RIH82100.1 hypothetical protein Mlute_02604 [Meiothermus luteus]RMH55046.1 MAG: hypothetical protein D6684_08290 [Deinococcota bacterium]
MKKPIALMVVALVLSGCSNFVADFGIPTVRFNPVSAGPTASGYEVVFEVQSLPGSPSATLLQVNLSGSLTATIGSSVPECPPSTAADDCPKLTKTLTFASNPGLLAITGYVAQSLSGTLRTVTLPAQVIINQ